MRTRPATPLSVLLLVAFTLLLLSVLSTPIVTSIHLAAHQNLTFGVFGFCDGDKCSGVRVGYDMNSPSSDFSLPSNARNSLSNLLIVHPIAALFTLVLLALSIGAHLHGPAHSPRYLLALLILSLPTFLLSLLAFLVDILIFLPHVQWGGWVVLASTVLIAISGIVMCGIRRTVVSREARRKRIEVNAAMNGADVYASQAAARQQAVPPTDKPPEFATFEVNNPARAEPEGERIPLNPRSRTVSPPPADAGSRAGSFTRTGTLTREPSERSMGYGPPPRGAGPLSRPMPSGQVRNQFSNGALRQGGGYDRGYAGDRGLGGERGYVGDRGGYGGERYDQGSLGGFRGPTPPGMYPPPGGGLAPPPRRGPSPGQFVPRSQSGAGYGGGPHGYGMGPSPGRMGGSPPPNNGMMERAGMMGGSPPPMMVGGRGRPMPPPGPRQFNYPSNDEIPDERREFEQTLPPVNGIGLATSGDEREHHGPLELPDGSVIESQSGRLSVVNEGQTMPHEEYVPPRQAWRADSSNNSTPPPVELPASTTSEHPLPQPPLPQNSLPRDPSPRRSSPQELPPQELPPQELPPQELPPPQQPAARSSYYEDVAPAFDDSHQPHTHTSGFQSPPPALENGPRPPVASHFTSASQRAPNPMWRPDYQER